MNHYTATVLYRAHAELGECPVWDEKRNKLWWVDITKGYLNHLDVGTARNEEIRLGTPVGSFVFDDNGDVLCAVKNGFMRYVVDRGETHMLKIVEHANQSVRFNDGKCDPQGRFWAGTLAEDKTRDAGTLYCLEHDLSLVAKIEHVGISNGIEWNHSGDTMYYIDSMSQKVSAFTYDIQTGDVSLQRTIITIDEEEGTPDGMCIDEEGMLWVALWEGGKVIRIDPKSGERRGEVLVPGVSRVTSCTFGGDTMQTLFITTARKEYIEKAGEEEQDAGSLFSVCVDVRGVTPSTFGLKEKPYIL